MIYGFIKTNNEYVSKEEQEKTITQFASKKGLVIDKYIIDDYKTSYNEIYNIKRGYGTGSYIFNLKRGDILICANFYTLAYSFKTVLFLIKTALEQGAKVYSVEGNVKLDKNNLKTIKIIYNINCFFNHQREEKKLKPTWKLKLEPFQTEIEVLIRQGTTIQDICKKYHTSYQAVRNFLNRHTELDEIYRENSAYFKKDRKTKMLEKRPLLKSQVELYIRKAQASIVPEHTLLLAKSMKKTSTE